MAYTPDTRDKTLAEKDTEDNQLLATLLDNRFKQTVDDIDFYVTEYQEYERSGFVHTIPLARYILLKLTEDLRK